MVDEDEDAGFEITPEMLAVGKGLAEKLAESEGSQDEQQPAAEYHDPVIEEAAAHIGVALPCLCARCPAAVWEISDPKGRSITTESGELARADEQSPWQVTIFCRAMHRDTAKFTPDYAKKVLKPVGESRVVWRCTAYHAELRTWQKEQG
jgi:hypothetical protein